MQLPIRLILATTISNNATQSYTQQMRRRLQIKKSLRKKIKHIMYMDEIRIFSKKEK